jgi:hypothetical protein
MVLPGFVKEHPAISIVSVLAFFGLLALLSMIAVPGELAGQDSCGNWEPAVNPDTGELFESEDAVNQYFEEDGFQVRNSGGQLQYKAPCGTVGGGVN